MKKRTTIYTFAALALITLASCTKPCSSCDEPIGEAELKIELTTQQTRSATPPTPSQDNTINSLDIFIFRDSDPASPDYQKLDTYKHLQGSEMENISISTTTGPKLIYVVANDHSNTFSGVTNLTEFRKLTTSLADERLGSFTMFGEASATLSTTSSVSITLERFVARVAITSIKTNFSGTPYAGKTLSDIKLYLINVHGEKLLYNGTPASASPLLLNPGGLIGTDANSTAEANLIYEPISGTIDDSGTDVPHWFHCYPNTTEEISGSTKMVLQCSLDGVTYYYPIPVNQPGYGYNPSNGHYGVKRNCSYSYGITITRPGSLDPDEPIIPGTLELNIGVSEWNVIPHFHKEF